jgi:hypothetical protein
MLIWLRGQHHRKVLKIPLREPCALDPGTPSERAGKGAITRNHNTTALLTELRGNAAGQTRQENPHPL